jgi:hypothetical protein
VGDTVSIRWDNREVKGEGLPVWEAQVGEVTLSVSDFLEEVKSFNARLLQAMEAQVAAVCEALADPDMKSRLADLVRQHRERSGWLEKALLSSARDYEWDEVRRAMATIEQASTWEHGRETGGDPA